jgi:hypothetical protein
MYGETEGMQKEVVMAYFKVLTWHSSARTEEIHKNFRQDRQCSECDLNQFPHQQIQVSCIISEPTCLVLVQLKLCLLHSQVIHLNNETIRFPASKACILVCHILKLFKWQNKSLTVHMTT